MHLPLSALLLSLATPAPAQEADASTLQALEALGYVGQDAAESSSERGWLGVMMDGLQVTGTFPGSPAEGAGMQAGDRIVSLDGEDLEGFDALVGMLSERAPGQQAAVGIHRASEIELGEFEGRALLGVHLSDRGGAVYISEVVPDSAAAGAGFEAGDQILSLAGNDCSSSAQVAEAISGRSPGDKLAVGIGRTVELSLGERPAESQTTFTDEAAEDVFGGLVIEEGEEPSEGFFFEDVTEGEESSDSFIFEDLTESEEEHAEEPEAPEEHGEGHAEERRGEHAEGRGRIRVSPGGRFTLRRPDGEGRSGVIHLDSGAASAEQTEELVNQVRELAAQIQQLREELQELRAELRKMR